MDTFVGLKRFYEICMGTDGHFGRDDIYSIQATDAK